MSAKSNVPWSVKGIDHDARSVAKELARRQGMTLGEWITAMIREKGLDEAGVPDGDDASSQVVSGVTTDQLRGVVDTLNRLNERLKVAEKHLQQSEVQSRQAMGGLNQGLETVFERIKRLERETQTVQDVPGIAERLDKLEGESGDKKSWVTSLKALERALTTLVDQVETSRGATEERLQQNEDLIAELQARLDAEDDELRREISILLEAIDRTTERVAATEERVTEALGIAREAAESHDESFIERTGNNLRLLGSEIKRTSDHIRSLEQSLDKLQDKIEAGEERSAEGISRVAASLETLRAEIEKESLKQGTPSTGSVRASVAEADRRIEALSGAFSAVVDRLEGRLSGGDVVPEVTIAGGSVDDAPTAAPEGILDDFTAPSPEDEFDRVFDDPLGFSEPTKAPETPRQERPRDPKEPEAFFNNPSFGGNAPVYAAGGGAAMGAAQALAIDPVYDQQADLDRAPEPEPQPEPELAPEPVQNSADEPREDRWEGIRFASSQRPSDEVAEEPAPKDVREPFRSFGDEEPENMADRLFAKIKSATASDGDNNPFLGWMLILAATIAIILTAIRLAAPDDMEPVIVEPATSSTPQRVDVEPTLPTPTRETPSTAALYTEAKERLATAGSPEAVDVAVALLTRAADGGSALAQHDLGELYLAGDGVPEDGFRARQWFAMAADQGHLPSVNRLAYLDIKGVGGAVDIDASLNGFTRAARAGYVKAMINLGTLYNPENAWLPDERRSAEESYFWFRLAETRGDRSALSEADLVASRLGSELRASIETRAASWQPVPLSR